jgi:hypothetical protein
MFAKLAYTSLAFAAVLSGVAFGVTRAAGFPFDIATALTLLTGLTVACGAVQYVVNQVVGVPWLK